MALEVSADELSKVDLLREFDFRRGVTCKLSPKQGKALRRLWASYDAYAHSAHGSRAAVVVKVRGLLWVVRQFCFEFRYPALHQLADIYVMRASELRPVRFESSNDMVYVHLEAAQAL